MRIVSYANRTFRDAQIVQSMRALELGFQHVLQFSELDLSHDFRKKNAGTLSMSRGAGYWIWKPSIILQYTQSLKTDFQVLYLDSGSLPRKSALEFQNLLVDDRIHVWEIGNQDIKTWTDKKVLDSLGVGERSRNSPMIWAGALCARNSKTLEVFLKTWETLCSNPEYLHPETLPSYKKDDLVIWHRHDQSLLSILVAENPEWFCVHQNSDKKDNWTSFFDRHKKSKISYVLLVQTFPKLRNLRRNIIVRLPKIIRVILRDFRDRFNGKNLSNAESKSLRKNFY